MKLTHTYSALLLLFGMIWTGYASAAFITDVIDVDIYAQPFGQGAKLATIKSGEDVQVLSSDGEYARILTSNNLTGWIEAKYITDSKPGTTDLQALEKKNSDQAVEIKALKDKLASQQKSMPSSKELKSLRQAAKDVKWMRVELKKSREKVKTLEESASTTKSDTAAAAQELEQLKTHNADLEQRLAAALLINQQQQVAEMAAAPTELETDQQANQTNTSLAENNGWSFQPQWFLGSLFTAIIIGIIFGMVWMDKRMRKRHGGFRLY